MYKISTESKIFARLSFHESKKFN
ncbi:hypothetical protein B4U79_02123 [Dinothrombium tinctorium]|uniref:Uncharacterized protein n=1 Tax=Dinothrombium tinctorium TaxID=1965070 RepID=A0A3S3NS50_9ACAR|nr:hypothetical protein B4U79_13277 [Dinothrombium tinctorium]RWS00734.1 hypothetical protein B4U79_10300 [Dinothrombium tinctorium]RWS06248.1 hypothetical protein B4U79_02123 [Dinothrombium tinctorium]